MTSVLMTCCNHRVCFPLLKTTALTVCNLFSRFEISYFIWKLLEYNSLWCKNVMVTVSLDSPSCEVTLFDPVYRWFIGMLPDRPRDYTVWSTLEPSGVDSRTWASIIQVGSATAYQKSAELVADCWSIATKVYWLSSRYTRHNQDLYIERGSNKIAIKTTAKARVLVWKGLLNITQLSHQYGIQVVMHTFR
jgi:hypothetical protein